MLHFSLDLDGGTMDWMKLAIVIQGTSGSGKSTAAREMARRMKAILLEHDLFLFGTQPHKPEGKEHFTIGNAMMWSCFEIALETGRPIVLEGVLATFDTSINTFDLQEYLDTLHELEYKVVRVVLQTHFENASTRMASRLSQDGHATAVQKELYDKLEAALWYTLTPDVVKIDTTEMSTDAVVLKIESIVSTVTS